MRTFNTMSIGTANSLEPGDKITREFLGGIISGTVEAIPAAVYNLNEEVLTYMQEKDLLGTAPAQWQMLAGPSERFLYGTFVEINREGKVREFKHMYLDSSVVVCVMHSAER